VLLGQRYWCSVESGRREGGSFMVEDAVLCATAKVVVKLAWRASPAATMVVGRKWGSVFLCVHLVLSSSSMVLWGS
jgi:hypothetical protein